MPDQGIKAFPCNYVLGVNYMSWKGLTSKLAERIGNAYSGKSIDAAYMQHLKAVSEGDAKSIYAIIRNPKLLQRLSEDAQNAAQDLLLLSEDMERHTTAMTSIESEKSSLEQKRGECNTQAENYKNMKHAIKKLEEKAKSEMVTIHTKTGDSLDPNSTSIHDCLQTAERQHQLLAELQEKITSGQESLTREARTSEFSHCLRTYIDRFAAHADALRRADAQREILLKEALFSCNALGLENDGESEIYVELLKKENIEKDELDAIKAELDVIAENLQSSDITKMSEGLRRSMTNKLNVRKSANEKKLTTIESDFEKTKRERLKLESKATASLSKISGVFASNPGRVIVDSYGAILLKQQHGEQIPAGIALYNEAIKDAGQAEKDMFVGLRKLVVSAARLFEVDQNVFFSSPEKYAYFLDTLDKRAHYKQKSAELMTEALVAPFNAPAISKKLHARYQINNDRKAILNAAASILGERKSKHGQIMTKETQKSILENAEGTFRNAENEYVEVLKSTAILFGLVGKPENESAIVNALKKEIDEYAKVLKILQKSESDAEQELGSKEITRKSQKDSWETMIPILEGRVESIAAKIAELDNKHIELKKELDSAALNVPDLERAAAEKIKLEYEAIASSEKKNTERTSVSPGKLVETHPDAQKLQYRISDKDSDNTLSLYKLWFYGHLPDLAALSSVILPLASVQAGGALAYDEPNELGRIWENIKLLVSGAELGEFPARGLIDTGIAVTALASLGGTIIYLERAIERSGKSKGIRVRNVGEDRIKGQKVAGAHTISGMSQDVKEYLGRVNLVGVIDARRVGKERSIPDIAIIDGTQSIKSTNPSSEIVITKAGELEQKIIATTKTIGKKMPLSGNISSRGKTSRIPVIGRTIDALMSGKMETTNDLSKATISHEKVKGIVEGVEKGDAVIVYHRIPDGIRRAFFEIYAYTVADNDTILNIEGTDEIRVLTGEDSRITTKAGLGGIKELERYGTPTIKSSASRNPLRIFWS